jgi:uncharacterized protein
MVGPFQGYQVTFFTQQDRLQDDMPLAQWLIVQAGKLGFSGATLTGSLEGLGHDGRTHAVNMFDFSDQPVQTTMVLRNEELKRLFAFLEEQKVRVFYTKAAVEFGTLGPVETA